MFCYADVTVEKLSSFIPAFLKNLNIECLIHGNVTKEVQHAKYLMIILISSATDLLILLLFSRRKLFVS